MISSNYFQRKTKYIPWYTRILAGHFSLVLDKPNKLEYFEDSKECPFCLKPIENDFRIHLFIDCLKDKIISNRKKFVKKIRKILSNNPLQSDLNVLDMGWQCTQVGEKREVVKVLLGGIKENNDKERKLSDSDVCQRIVEKSAAFLWKTLRKGNRQKLSGS